jgi:hypothetical protein
VRACAACQPDELEASLHDVVGTPVAGNNMSRLSSPHNFALSAPGELVKCRFEGALLNFLARMGLFNRLQSRRCRHIWVALLEFPDRRRQIEI